MAGEQAAPFGPALWLVVGVVQADQAEEFIGQADGAGVRHAVGEAAVTLDDFDVPLEAGPAGKAVPACHYELRGVQRERAGHIAHALGDLGERIGFTGQDGSLQVFGLVAELLETRLTGKAGHGGSFRHACGPRRQAERR